jgi:hypothetical protein
MRPAGFRIWVQDGRLGSAVLVCERQGLRLATSYDGQASSRKKIDKSAFRSDLTMSGDGVEVVILR